MKFGKMVCKAIQGDFHTTKSLHGDPFAFKMAATENAAFKKTDSENIRKCQFYVTEYLI